MSSRLSPRTLRPRAGSAVTGLFLGGLAVSAAFAVLVGPLGERSANAQSMANPNDQPTPATVPTRDGARAADQSAGTVAPPSAIKSSTSVVSSDRKKSSYTNPLDHLPARDRAGTGGRGE
ncbi:hypothetical protein G3T14_02620 [Methylobacterium sp. BTF04]|uniref:hypothetical protein n=1 Tax=Methylobacterium sp. BTF04 TaxID=2708300 RepID=UPI0013D02399|nr:hypothetical protein [Methylobacterium sp. BTF04]NEU11026.1 hypothetical protein [Methylobacterium sp. BTF04]